MIRWSYLIPRATVLGLIWLFGLFLLDPLAERGLESAGSAVLGAKIEVDALELDLFPPGLRLRGFAAADPKDPMRNLVEFASAGFALEGWPLLERRFVIPQAELRGLRAGAPRKSSGALGKQPPSRAAEAVAAWAGSGKDALADAASAAKGDLAAEYTIDPAQLRSARLAEELKDKWQGTASEWEARLAKLDVQGRAARLERQAKDLERADPVSKVAGAKKLLDEVKALRAGLAEAKSGLEGALAHARAGLAAIEQAKKGDLDALMDKLKLPRLDAQRLSAYLLGEVAGPRVARALRLLESFRRWRAEGREPESRPAARGEDIAFPGARPKPRVWLKKLDLSGTLELGAPLALAGSAADIASEPRLVGAPATLSLSGKDPGRSVSLDASFDHRGEAPQEKLALDAAGLALPAFTAGDPRSFALLVGSGTLRLSALALLSGESLSGQARFADAGAALTPMAESLDPRLRAALGSAFSGVRALEGTLGFGGTLSEPRLSLTSNLGEAAAAGLRQALGKELEARKKELSAKLDAVVAERSKGLREQIESQRAALAGRLGAGEQTLDALAKRIAGVSGAPGLKLPALDRLFR